MAEAAKNPFDLVEATPEQSKQLLALREQFVSLLDTLLALPPSREKALAITKLEEASMWGNKAIVFN